MDWYNHFINLIDIYFGNEIHNKKRLSKYKRNTMYNVLKEDIISLKTTNDITKSQYDFLISKLTTFRQYNKGLK